MLCTNVYGQKYNIKTYSVNEGLPSSQVFDVHLDDNGIVWFGTAYGLVKFDGYNYETFDKKNGLRDEFIYEIFEDSEQNIWVSTEAGGVALFQSDSLIYLESLARLDGKTIQKIIESPSNELWFGSYEEGIIVWNKEDSAFREISMNEGLPDTTIWDIYFDDEGKAWIGTWEGVSIYEEGKGVTKVLTEADGLSGYAAYQVFEASDGRKWIPTSDGVSIINKDFSIEVIKDLDGHKLDYVYNISEGDDGLIWIGTERKGLFWYHPGTRESTHISKKNGLSSNYIYRLIKATDGTIWVATDGNGVSIFKDKRFTFFDSGTPFGFNAVFGSLVAEDGTLWFGVDNGLSKYKNGEFTFFPLPPAKYFEQEIWDIEELPNGNLLLLTYDFGVIEFDGSEFSDYVFKEKLPSYYVNDILIDGESIWLAVEDGIIKYEKGKFEKFSPPKEEGYWSAYTNVVEKDRTGNFWLGTENGLAYFDGKEFTFYREEEGLKSITVNEIKEDAFGNIWIGTNKGLSVIEQEDIASKEKKVTSFDSEDVFLNETIFLQFDAKGGLWQGTNGGVNYYNLTNWYDGGEISKIYFPLQDYGKGVEMNGGSSLMDKDKNLWFGTASKGLIKYNTNEGSSFPTTAEPPKTYIRSVLANGDVVFEQRIGEQIPGSIELDYEENNLEIHFAAVNFKDPYRILYKYRLKGFEEKWRTEFDANEVIYTSLPAGTYDFEVMAKSVKSDWGTVPATIKLTIDKPIWLSNSFFFVVAITLLGLMILYINVRLNMVEKQKLKKLVDEQTKDLINALGEKEALIKEVHHRVKNNLAVISGLFELQIWKSKNDAVSKILRNSQLRIRSMSIIHEQLYQSESLSKIGFKRYMENLISAITASMDSDEIDIAVESEIDDAIHLTITQAVPCGLIMNELLSNAYEHAFVYRSSGKITISITQEKGNKIRIIVQDNGVGIPPEKIGGTKDSLGMTLVNTLVQQLKGEIGYLNERGSKFVITFEKDKFNVGFIDK